MASIKRSSNGTHTARWYSAAGKLIEVCTGEIVVERAARKAAEMEAEARFWEDHQLGCWQRLADAAFSPRYLHNVFTCARHMPFPKFRRCLVEAGVKFKAAASWRDRARPRGRKGGKTWKWKGESLTFEELMQHAADGITKAALRFRLDKQWDIDAALTTPPMSRSESGAIGARITNTKP